MRLGLQLLLLTLCCWAADVAQGARVRVSASSSGTKQHHREGSATSLFKRLGEKRLVVIYNRQPMVIPSRSQVARSLKRIKSLDNRSNNVVESILRNRNSMAREERRIAEQKQKKQLKNKENRMAVLKKRAKRREARFESLVFRDERLLTRWSLIDKKTSNRIDAEINKVIRTEHQPKSRKSAVLVPEARIQHMLRMLVKSQKSYRRTIPKRLDNIRRHVHIEEQINDLESKIARLKSGDKKRREELSQRRQKLKRRIVSLRHKIATQEDRIVADIKDGARIPLQYGVFSKATLNSMVSNTMRVYKRTEKRVKTRVGQQIMSVKNPMATEGDSSSQKGHVGINKKVKRLKRRVEKNKDRMTRIAKREELLTSKLQKSIEKLRAIESQIGTSRSGSSKSKVRSDLREKRDRLRKRVGRMSERLRRLRQRTENVERRSERQAKRLESAVAKKRMLKGDTVEKLRRKKKLAGDQKAASDKEDRNKNVKRHLKAH